MEIHDLVYNDHPQSCVNNKLIHLTVNTSLLQITRLQPRIDAKIMGRTKVDLAPVLMQETTPRPDSNKNSWSDRHSGVRGLPHSPVMNADHAIGA